MYTISQVTGEHPFPVVTPSNLLHLLTYHLRVQLVLLFDFTTNYKISSKKSEKWVIKNELKECFLNNTFDIAKEYLENIV